MSASTRTQVLSLNEALRKVAEHLQAGALDSADDLLQQLRIQTPESASVLGFLGMLHSRRGQSVAARAVWADALRADPDSLVAWQNYGLSISKETDTADLDLLRESLLRARWPEPQRMQVVFTVLDWLGFEQRQPFAHLQRLFEQLVLPWLEWAFAQGCCNLGLWLEARVYRDYIKARETEAHTRETYERLLPSITQAARVLKVQLEALPERTDSVSSRKEAPPKIGYFLHRASKLAHVETLFNLFSALRADDTPAFEPVLFVVEGEDSVFDARCAELKLTVVRLNQGPAVEHGNNALLHLLTLRQRLHQHGVHTLVWMSVLPWLAFAATLGMEVRLVWYSVKYHVLRLPGIHGYLTHGDGEPRAIHGHLWQTQWLAGQWYDPELQPKAQKVRENLAPHRLILGTLGREEKMLNPAFVECVAQLLREHPDVIYLWSGRSQPAIVLTTFERYGVLGQSRFLGWTQTRLMAQVIDVYLDTFPAPGGYTVREAMAAGAATVFFASPGADETGVNGFARRMLAGQGPPQDVTGARAMMHEGNETLFLLAETAEQYVQHARRLLADDAFRHRVSAANRAWIQYFYEDNARMLASHVRAVLDG